MANVGDKISVGDREGVVVRSVNIAEGVELTVRVPDEDHPQVGEYALPYDPHALILDGHGNTSAGVPGYDGTVEGAVAKNDELRERNEKASQEAEEKRDEALRETAAPAADETKAPAKPATTRTGTKAKGADNK